MKNDFDDFLKILEGRRRIFRRFAVSFFMIAFLLFIDILVCMEWLTPTMILIVLFLSTTSFYLFLETSFFFLSLTFGLFYLRRKIQ